MRLAIDLPERRPLLLESRPARRCAYNVCIYFIRAKEIWSGDVLDVPSPQDGHGEKRHLAYGRLEGRIIAVVYTWRGKACRIISARRARDYERDAYESAFGRAARG